MKEDNVIIKLTTDTFNYKFLQPNDCNKNNTNIIGNKGIKNNPIYNIDKRGQEILKTAYGI